MYRTRKLGGLILVSLVLVVGACTRPASPERAADAWSDRLNGQAGAYQLQQQARQRAMDAYAGRLMAEAAATRVERARRERAERAWAERYSRQAGMSERATQAWSDRLNGLAAAVAGNE